MPTARSQRSRPDHKLLKTVTPERVHTTTVGDLLANRWQLAVQGAPGIEEAGCWTRPVASPEEEEPLVASDLPADHYQWSYDTLRGDRLEKFAVWSTTLAARCRHQFAAPLRHR